jgi:hypothetical protein
VCTSYELRLKRDALKNETLNNKTVTSERLKEAIFAGRDTQE